MSSALEPDIAPETAVLRSRPPKPLLEHPPKRKLSTCSVANLPTSVHDLRSRKLPLEQRYMTIHSVVWETCRQNLQRLSASNCTPKLYFEITTPVFTASTDQAISPAGADSGGTVEVLAFSAPFLANQGRSCRYLCALYTHLTNRNKSRIENMPFMSYRKMAPLASTPYH